MENKEYGCSLTDIFDELEEIAQAMDRGLALLAVVEEAGRHETDRRDICSALAVLRDYLYAPARDLGSLAKAGRLLLEESA